MGQKSWPSPPVFLVAGLVGWTARAAIMSIIVCSDLGPHPSTHHSERNVPSTRQLAIKVKSQAGVGFDLSLGATIIDEDGGGEGGKPRFEARMETESRISA
ncbi:hypothetical protein NL676_023390 [Syzygium grande]|nr:hypothetical protein NL676_023390 [Syzygium grande]